MPRGLLVLVIALPGLLALAAPVFLVARRQRRYDTVRNFAISAAVIALLCVAVEVVSERQVAQCVAAGNAECIDAGASGLQLLFAGGYVVAAWVAAYSMAHG
ncbi:MAG: hypothetical protein L0Z47_06935 [Actinobacteria bacterium]|nr:hypothetical protein [Actinomycetota bacterium]